MYNCIKSSCHFRMPDSTCQVLSVYSHNLNHESGTKCVTYVRKTQTAHVCHHHQYHCTEKHLHDTNFYENIYNRKLATDRNNNKHLYTNHNNKCEMPWPLGPHRFTFMWWGWCGLCLWYKSTQLAHSFFLNSVPVSVSVFLALSMVFHSINSLDNALCAFSLCSSGLVSTSSVLSAIYLLIKVFLSPDINNPLWLTGLKAPTN